MLVVEGGVDTVADIVEGLGEVRMDITHTVGVAGELVYPLYVLGPQVECLARGRGRGF